ncbi:DoxX family membrane protein [Fluviicola sp.]|uniref:DoxX family protein n=1 Tax=Fluviicola sp. TaxID=1917219 RepID=UPI0026075902|nr:DoxX family membrane protein [Fluviicola sp.]
MEIIEQYHYVSAVTIARIFLGILFLFQGYDAVVKIGMKNVIDAYQKRFAVKGIPRSLTSIAALFTSYTELICGALLIFGLFEFIILYLLGLNLIIAGIGFGINEPLWDTRHVFPRLVLLLLLLMTPPEWHSFSLDHIFFKS